MHADTWSKRNVSTSGRVRRSAGTPPKSSTGRRPGGRCTQASDHHIVRSRPATPEEFLAHKEDTRSEWEMPDGTVLLVYPEIVAEVRFDLSFERWLVFGIGTEPIVLDLDDPEADDSAVLAHCESELYRYCFTILR